MESTSTIAVGSRAGRLVSVNVGKPRAVAWKGKSVTTGIWKAPVDGRVMARRLNLDGDEQADKQGHGGEQRAVLVYQLSSYAHWSGYLGRQLEGYGEFGENLTVDGLEDREVCVGDRYQIGGAVFEVSQPRVTCFKVGIRLGRSELPAMLVAHGRPGFYMRVVREGLIGAGDEIVKLAAGPESMTVSDIDALLYKNEHPKDLLERALSIGALSPGWRHSFNALLDAARKGSSDNNAGLGIDIGRPPAWTGFRSMRVLDVVPESDDISSFILAARDGSPLPASLPGQHVAVKVPIDSSGGTVTRMYSLSGAPTATNYRISVKREEHGIGSQALHSRMRPGDFLEISAPRGTFVLEAGGGPVVLLSAGVGATPMLAMLHALSGSGDQARDVWWIHSARDGRHHAFADEVRALLSSIRQARSHIAYSRPSAADLEGTRSDSIGRLSVDKFSSLGLSQGADFYLCGPGPFLTGMQKDLLAWGVRPDRIHIEFFGASVPVGATSERPPHAPENDEPTGATITFVKSGVTAHWNSRYESLLELAEACDVPVRWACRTGVCQNCRSSLLEGEIEYDPNPIDPPAQGTVLLCCSTPRTDLQLDL